MPTGPHRSAGRIWKHRSTTRQRISEFAAAIGTATVDRIRKLDRLTWNQKKRKRIAFFVSLFFMKRNFYSFVSTCATYHFWKAQPPWAVPILLYLSISSQCYTISHNTHTHNKKSGALTCVLFLSCSVLLTLTFSFSGPIDSIYIDSTSFTMPLLFFYAKAFSKKAVRRAFCRCIQLLMMIYLSGSACKLQSGPACSCCSDSCRSW